MGFAVREVQRILKSPKITDWRLRGEFIMNKTVIYDLIRMIQTKGTVHMVAERAIKKE